MKSTLDTKEVEKFSSLANEWWNESGKFKALHLMNPIRISYIRDYIMKYFNIDSSTLTPFHNLKILDVGCGGGLLSEPIYRLGANVTSLDASRENINTAKLHAEKMKLNINYIVNTIENFSIKNEDRFDVVLCMEIVEHVQNLNEFIKYCIYAMKPGGIIFFSTINRTIKSYLLAIVGAEYILRYVPIGTHDWNKFLKPSEINKLLKLYKSNIIDLHGLKYNPIASKKWALDKNLDINYILCAKKGV